MSIAAKTSSPQPAQKQGLRRIWKTPTSGARWFWLVLALVLFAGIFALYLVAIKTQQFPGPFNEPLLGFGIIAFVLVLSTAAYSLRRRFIRGLPGKAQAWLWMHVWIGIVALLIALLHENFTHVLNNYCQNLSCFSNSHWGTGALLALATLVITGIIGRLLDTWQAHSIARDASANGIGIARAIEEHILELEYTVERLSAGKSEPFKEYCLQAINMGASFSAPRPQLDARELTDFQRAQETLTNRMQLVLSLERQQRARFIIRTWRYIHITVACLALLVIAYHAVMELLINVLHILPV
jgi:heme/copper-type cytochrome/quinol oxidase subunit 3